MTIRDAKEWIRLTNILVDETEATSELKRDTSSTLMVLCSLIKHAETFIAEFEAKKLADTNSLKTDSSVENKV